MSVVINVGLIGCGDVATHSYMPGLNALSDRAKVVAVFDIVDSRVEDGKRFHPEATGYTDFDAFLAHGSDGSGEKMDLVFNLTPAPIHAEITEKAFEAGYSVYSEKPVASSVEDAQRLAAIAKVKDLKFFCAPAMMVTARFMWLKQAFADGMIGRPYFIKSHHAGMGPASWRSYSGDPRVFYTPKVGPLIDLGVYQLHAITGLFGPVKQISTYGGVMNEQRTLLQPRFFGEVIPVQAPDLYSINLDFGDGVYAHLFNSFAVPASKSPMFEAYGDMGSISISSRQWYDGNGSTDVYRRDESEAGEGEGWQDETPVPAPIETSGILESGILHALDVMAHGVPNILTADHATHVLEIMIAAGQSLVTGESIEIETTF